MFTTLLGLIFKMFFPIVFAYFLFKRGIFTTQTKKAITVFVMKFTVYFTIIMASQQDFSPAVGKILMQTAIFGALFFAITIPLSSFAGKALKLDDNKKRVFISSLAFCNIAFVGFPVTQELYGEVALLCAIMYDIEFNLVFYTYGLINLKSTKDMSIKSIVTNIYTLLSVISLILYFAQIKFPEPFYSTFSSLSSVTMPLVMALIGCLLAETGIKNILKDTEAYLPVFLNMFILPLIVFLVLKLIGADKELIRVCVIITALPTGTMTSIISTDTDCAPEYASNILILSNLAMLISLPMWVLIIG